MPPPTQLHCSCSLIARDSVVPLPLVKVLLVGESVPAPGAEGELSAGAPGAGEADGGSTKGRAQGCPVTVYRGVKLAGGTGNVVRTSGEHASHPPSATCAAWT